VKGGTGPLLRGKGVARDAGLREISAPGRKEPPGIKLRLEMPAEAESRKSNRSRSGTRDAGVQAARVRDAEWRAQCDECHPGRRDLQLEAAPREGARTKAAANAPQSKRWRVRQNPLGWDTLGFAGRIPPTQIRWTSAFAALRRHKPEWPQLDPCRQPLPGTVLGAHG